MAAPVSGWSAPQLSSRRSIARWLPLRPVARRCSTCSWLEESGRGNRHNVGHLGWGSPLHSPEGGRSPLEESAWPAPKGIAKCRHLSFSSANAEIDRAWQDPHHTRIELEAIDVNDQLQQYYFTSEPFRLTKPMLWDAEARKAWDPRTYIPRVVREGKSWGRRTLED